MLSNIDLLLEAKKIFERNRTPVRIRALGIFSHHLTKKPSEKSPNFSLGDELRYFFSLQNIFWSGKARPPEADAYETFPGIFFYGIS